MKICFKKNDFRVYLFEMESWFLVRVYPLKFFQNNIRQFEFAKPMNVLTYLKLRKGFP